MKSYKVALILINLVVVLALFHYSVGRKEAILRNGRLILLQLAPVDPRSLVQGDYMDLRYEIAGQDLPDPMPKRGYCVVRLDPGAVARKVRWQTGRQPLRAGEYLIEYTAPNRWRPSIGAESYFFEEGQSASFQRAQYGGLKVDDRGNSVLVGLYDKDQRLIK